MLSIAGGDADVTENRPSDASANRLVKYLLERGLGGVPPLSSAEDLATEYLIDQGYADHDARVFDVIMLRFFTGLSVEQTADVLESSPRTVKRCWSYGRTWLYRRITAGE